MNSDVCVTHAKPHGKPSGRNLEIYENLLTEGRALSARGQYYYARELKDHGRYSDAAKWFAIFLDSEKGWIEDNITACSELAKCYLAENRPREALASMLRGFSYDTPRAELCCQIGYYFKELGHYGQAAFWFALALSLKHDHNNLGFQQEDCSGYIPCIELAVCYDKLGAYKKAAECNEMAAVYKPDSSAVLHNRSYFSHRLADNGIDNKA
jgi:tetratricopeptide (TPR) repeat protein